MKKIKKIFTLLIAMVMVLGMSTMVFAGKNGTITITPPSGTQDGTTNNYSIYKVFEADGDGTNISYKLVPGKSAPLMATDKLSKFDTDSAGNVQYYTRMNTEAEFTLNTTDTELSAGMISAIGTYVNGDTAVATATSTGKAAAVTTDLPNGYYYITTSTGSVVTINSTNPNATVNDKNTVPPVTKVISSVGTGSLDEKGKAAVAEVGTTVNYTATITVGKGAKNYVFHDTMTTGLALFGTPTVTATPPEDGSAPTGNWYNVKSTADTGDTLTITFIDGIEEGTVITIAYSAIITTDALTVDSANNTAKVTYGDNNSSTNIPGTKVYTGSIEATKKDGKNTEVTTDDTALAGAGFVLKNSAGRYYKYNAIAVGEQPAGVVWVDSIGDADVHSSGSDGKVPAFTGLGAGSYTLVEKTVPSGFNKAADVNGVVVPVPKTDDNGEITNKSDLAVDAGTILNNQGSVLPSTGGIGTTIFYVIGAILVIGAGVVLVTRRRMNVQH